MIKGGLIMSEKKAALIIRLLVLIIVALVIPGALPGIIIGYLLYLLIKSVKKNKDDLTQ